MALYPELDHLTLAELITAFHDAPPEGDYYAAAFYDEVTSRIRTHGEAGIRFLFDAATHATGDRLASILVGLAPIQIQTTEPGLGDILRRCLRDSSARVVMAAIDGFRLHNDCSAIDDFLSLRNHPSSLVRGGVLRYVRACCPEQAEAMLVAALKDHDPIVRGSAIDELDELGIANASTLLAPLLHDPNPDVRRAAEIVIDEARTEPWRRVASR